MFLIKFDLAYIRNGSMFIFFMCGGLDQCTNWHQLLAMCRALFGTILRMLRV